MTAQAGESPTLRGFTVRNGRAMAADGYSGGGVRTNGGPAVIEDNVITANATCDAGGGIHASFSQAVIRHNRVEGNFQSGCSGGAGGGGVFIGGDGAVSLVDNVIAGNRHGSWGAGVSLFAAGAPTIARNVIRGNSGAQGGGGFWIVNRSDAQIENNVIVGNSATEGAGVYWLVPSGDRGPALVNNTIVANSGSVDATSPQGATVTFSATAVDDRDPNPTVTCAPSSGSVFAIGITAVTCTARDAAGNSSSGSFTVTVRGVAAQITALRAQVALLADEKLGRSLDSKLRDAANAVSAGQKAKACTKLAAFIAEVQNHAGGKIPAATASAWVADATRIRAVVGC
jgi:hypothetical protein